MFDPMWLCVELDFKCYTINVNDICYIHYDVKLRNVYIKLQNDECLVFKNATQSDYTVITETLRGIL